MAVFSIIQRKSIGKSARIDPDYYQPGYLQLSKRLSQAVFKEKGILKRYVHSAINFGAYSLCNYIVFVDSGVPYLYTQDIRDNYIDLNSLHFITTEVDKLLYKSQVTDRQVLLTMAGVYLGRASVFDYGIHANSNQAIAKITVREDLLNPYYLSTFLNSLYGSFQIRRNKTGTARDNINLGQIQDFFICLPSNRFQLQIEQIVKLGKQKLSYSKQLFTQAEQLLLLELGFQEWQPHHTLTYVKNYHHATQAGRIDAEHFQPKYDEVERVIAGYRPKRLSQLANYIIDTVQFDEQKKYRYIEISDVNTSNGEISYTEREVKDLPPNAKIKVKGGELIVSKVRPTRGAIGVVPDGLENGVCSSAFVVLDAPSPIKELLQVYLRSTIGKTLLEKPCKGTSYPTIDDTDVKALPIPTVSLQTQEKISELIIQSHLDRREAIALLEKAKHAVEIAIEEGETKAMELLKNIST